MRANFFNMVIMLRKINTVIFRGRYWNMPQICEKILNQTNYTPFCSHTCLDYPKKNSIVVPIGGDLAAIFLKSVFFGVGCLIIKLTKKTKNVKTINDTTFKDFLGSRNQIKIVVWWKNYNFSLKGHIKVIERSSANMCCI